jgi:hypothetical protein
MKLRHDDHLQQFLLSSRSLQRLTIDGTSNKGQLGLVVPANINCCSSLRYLSVTDINCSSGHLTNEPFDITLLPLLVSLELERCYIGTLFTGASLTSLRIINTFFQQVADIRATSSSLHHLEMIHDPDHRPSYEGVTHCCWLWPSLPMLSLRNAIIRDSVSSHMPAMSYREKQRLKHDIFKLPQSHLGVVIEIIQHGMPLADIEEIEIDIDRIHLPTLRDLQRYVKRSLAELKLDHRSWG